MPISEAKKRANSRYDGKAYDQMVMRVKKGDKAIIAAHADKHGESINAFLKRAVYNQIELNNIADSLSDEFKNSAI